MLCITEIYLYRPNHSYWFLPPLRTQKFGHKLFNKCIKHLSNFPRNKIAKISKHKLNTKETPAATIWQKMRLKNKTKPDNQNEIQIVKL
jgi:hypothetical protein